MKKKYLFFVVVVVLFLSTGHMANSQSSVDSLKVRNIALKQVQKLDLMVGLTPDQKNQMESIYYENGMIRIEMRNLKNNLNKRKELQTKYQKNVAEIDVLLTEEQKYKKNEKLKKVKK